MSTAQRELEELVSWDFPLNPFVQNAMNLKFSIHIYREEFEKQLVYKPKKKKEKLMKKLQYKRKGMHFSQKHLHSNRKKDLLMKK